MIKCSVPGGLRRCGGQGDLLAGSIATFLAWARFKDPSTHLSAALGACTLIKTVSARAFKENGRSTLATDMIPLLGRTFRELYE